MPAPRSSRRWRVAAVVFAVVTVVAADGLASVPPAAASSPPCGPAGAPPGVACRAARAAGAALPVSVGGQLTSSVGSVGSVGGLGGLVGSGSGPGGLVGSAGGLGGLVGPAAGSLPALFGLSVLSGAVAASAKFALDETARVIGRTTTPQLRSVWFSTTYWHMAAIAAVLTLPFLFAAAVQAVIRSDLALLLRAAFGYLPLAMLAIGIAAPVTMLLLASSDELARAVSAASGGADAGFLGRAAVIMGSLSAGGSPFLAFLIGGLTVAGAIVLWMELVMREAAVYVIVLMLPLAFAALVWPARRVWAIRAVEILVALVLSKFTIVAVLSLGGAAMAASLGSANVESWLAGLVLLAMAAFTPWALMRFIPLAELAAGAAGGLRHELHRSIVTPADKAVSTARQAHEAISSAMDGLQQETERADAQAQAQDLARGAGPAAAEDPTGQETRAEGNAASAADGQTTAGAAADGQTTAGAAAEGQTTAEGGTDPARADSEVLPGWTPGADVDAVLPIEREVDDGPGRRSARADRPEADAAPGRAEDPVDPPDPAPGQQSPEDGRL